MLNAIALQLKMQIKKCPKRGIFLLEQAYIFDNIYLYQRMRKVIYLITALFIGVGIADAAVRDANSISRDTTKNTTARDTTTKNITARNTTKNTVSRTATTARTNSRTTTTARVAKPTTNARNATTNKIVRATIPATARAGTRSARATTTMNTIHSNTFGTGYNTCRDAYFTCMDQFCGTANDTYRRCICSSKLSEIQSRERALSKASDQLSDFHNLNMSVIDKTAAEVQAMTSATTGEYTQSISNDKSAAASQLAGISDVLSKTKNKSLSTQGTLDIAGNINEIWATTDLTGGTNIANLTGEALYNAVHAQCSQIVIDKCPDQTTQTMVVSAYGMYIENDCSMLINTLDKKLTNANANIRESEREMNIARLENYNTHNSTSINDCIAQVRADITADTACGTDYVHCLDITGRYLNIETGEPIYSPNFYQLESQLSLAGDVLTNETNRLLVTELNKKRSYASRGLDTCRDIADAVWDEFMRQAISEIYQGQQERIRTVKNECLDVVNTCYDQQSQSLKDFSNIKEQLLLGSRLELSEEMCREKLDTCSNLYGGGAHGMAELLATMYNITSQTIAKSCQTILQDYARDLCAVHSNDSLHTYPYTCRIYTPGEQRFAAIPECNKRTQNNKTNIRNNNSDTESSCANIKKYTSCKEGYFMTLNGIYNGTPTVGNTCSPCNTGCECAGGTADQVCQTDTTSDTEETNLCGDDYVGSLYHKLARYAMQACVRPSEASKQDSQIPATVLQDINVVMDQIRIDMAKTLSDECERLDGIWVNTVWVNKLENTTCFDGQCFNQIKIPTQIIVDLNTPKEIIPRLHTTFYNETSSNTQWGYCTTKTTTTDTVSTEEIKKEQTTNEAESFSQDQTEK